MLRPVSGGCWGLRFPGGHQWHGGYDPVTVETCFRAAAAQSRGQGRRTGQEMNLHRGANSCCVQCSLPCVDTMGKEEPRALTCGHRQRRYSLETVPAKEAKNRRHPVWKTPRQSAMDIRRITVRTQWQSGTVFRQRHSADMKRELPARRRAVVCGESQPDLCRKIYSGYCHHFT